MHLHLWKSTCCKQELSRTSSNAGQEVLKNNSTPPLWLTPRCQDASENNYHESTFTETQQTLLAVSSAGTLGVATLAMLAAHPASNSGHHKPFRRIIGPEGRTQSAVCFMPWSTRTCDQMGTPSWLRKKCYLLKVVKREHFLWVKHSPNPVHVASGALPLKQRSVVPSMSLPTGDTCWQCHCTFVWCNAETTSKIY